MQHPKVLVYFSDGRSTTWTLRQLCGWARQHGARVHTDDGWPVVNGKVESFGVDAFPAGVVRSPEYVATLATWRILSATEVQKPLVQPAQQKFRGTLPSRHEPDWIVRS
jgi:hypothetical protein